MDSSEEIDINRGVEGEEVEKIDGGSEISENEVPDSDHLNASLQYSDVNSSKDGDSIGKKSKKKFRHGKKLPKDNKDSIERNSVRRIHHPIAKSKQSRKRAQSFPNISKFFLPHKRPRKEVFIPPTKFLLGGNISDPLNLNSLQDEDINRAMNAVTPESSPLPTPPRHKGKIDVIIPPNIRDPLNLMEQLDNEDFDKKMEMQQRKPRKKPRLRRKTTDIVQSHSSPSESSDNKEEVKEPMPPLPSTSRALKRTCSESDSSSQKGKDIKRLRRMDSLDKIVSPVVPQPGAWMRARPQTRTGPPERPNSPRTKLKASGEQKLPTFHPKNSRYQYGNYDRYYGYRNLNAKMDIRLQVFEMHKHLFHNKDVLDIGCNVGHISIAVAKSLGARSVVGIDIDPLLIGHARKNLRSFIPVPTEPQKIEDDKKETVDADDDKKVDCDQCKEKNEECVKCNPEEKTEDKCEDSRKLQRKIRRPRKNRKAVKQDHGQCFFPVSMSMLYGPLGDSLKDDYLPQTFPYNVTFKQGNYVPLEDVAVGSFECPQFDLILCLSTTKWMHLNWGDAGLKRAFRRMFNDLRPGGKLVLEAQNWASYKKKKRLTPTIYENFNSIEMFPNKFRDYLLSPEVGFSKSCILGVPQHASKGFRRPIQLYIKGDFTPSNVRWSDAYIPSSHHRPETEPSRRTVYAPVASGYRPSDDAPSCGAATPYSPNLDSCAGESPFYNPRSDSYTPSYQPPYSTVYATLPSPLGSASPAPSPAASPAPHASPAPDPLSARGFPEPRSCDD